MKQPAVKLVSGDGVEGNVVVVGCFERSAPDVGRLGRRLGSTASRAVERSGWKAQADQICRASTRGSNPVLVEVHGLGRSTSFTAEKLRKWISGVLSRAKSEGLPGVCIVLPAHQASGDRNSLALLRQLLLSGYRFDKYKKRDNRPGLKTIWLLPPSGEDDVYQKAMKVARPVAQAIRLARDLGNTPPNQANPDWMAGQAVVLAEKYGLDCRVLGDSELEELGMGGILAVGKGSANRPKMVRLEGGSGDRVVSFVGKGVTFDTGGISIKPSNGMEEMKYDKCGACTALGITQALATLDLPIGFRTYLPLVENMPGGGAYRPGDIVKCYNGRTVEILDTDAEGRMILADAMSWAAEEKPDALVEFSTLTGASVVALGHHAAALYSPDDELANNLLAAAEFSGEKLWRMPMWDEFADDMKGVHADLRNLGSRWGGANNAAAFLGNFVGRMSSWAHLDIAGTAYRASRESSVSGATGFGVALAVDWLLAETSSF